MLYNRAEETGILSQGCPFYQKHSESHNAVISLHCSTTSVVFQEAKMSVPLSRNWCVIQCVGVPAKSVSNNDCAQKAFEQFCRSYYQYFKYSQSFWILICRLAGANLSWHSIHLYHVHWCNLNRSSTQTTIHTILSTSNLVLTQTLH